ncbi:MAG: tRNA pseudouridine(38-40) synthase TruA [Alphaproteobacteria bacterium]|nr:tRNA pseudouridine(38-40) synthase TruA [Alphaproteobacteria bacterium]
MPRYRILLEYDGGPFVGWQAQANGPSVQSALEEAVFRFCGERVRVQGAGRTDAGVHAEGQVAHLDLEGARPPNVLRDAVNHHLGALPVSVLGAEGAAPDFHARFSATGRAYRYRILNRRAPPALDRGRVWHVGTPLDAGAMDEAARRLLGRHDFSSFRSSECQADSPVRTLDRLDVRREGDEVVLHAEARSFLHHQMRIIAGTLREAGIGKRTPDDVSAALKAASRPAAGPTAPPHGLCLTRVRY